MGRLAAGALHFVLAATLPCLGACGSTARTASPVPTVEAVWDIQDSTATGGRGPYFMGPASPRLRPGDVFVAFSCSGTGRLSVTPAIAAYDGEPPPETSPLAFEVGCPSTVMDSTLWMQLPVAAAGGENLAQVRLVGDAPGPIVYRFVFAQAPPDASAD
jgi:hypothetical protein